MKKFFTVVLAIILICGMFVGCSKEDEKTNETQQTTQTESKVDRDENTETTNNSNKDNTDEKSEEEKLAEQKALYTQYLSEIKTELLYAKSGLSYEQMIVDAYYPDEYGNQMTMLTLGIEFPNKEVANAFYGIDITGETATDFKLEGKPRQQSYDAYSTDDGLYKIYIYKIHGAIDTSKAHMHIKTKLDDVYEDRKFENNGMAVGFKTAIEKFSNKDDNMGLPSSVININNRHYKVISFGWFEADCSDLEVNQNKSGYEVYNQYRVGLYPLEGGRKITLKTEDLSLIAPKDNGITYQLKVYSENLNGGYGNIHTVIEVEASKYLDTIGLTDKGYPDYNAYKPINNEIDETVANVFIEVTNDTGKFQIPVRKND